MASHSRRAHTSKSGFFGRNAASSIPIPESRSPLTPCSGTGEFDVEHIWPRWISFDNSFANKTLCLKSLNVRKANRTPFEAFGNDPEWPQMKERAWALVKDGKMASGKAKRFCREGVLPEDFKE